MFAMFQLPFMVQAFIAALITGAVLSYLGVHVVGRGIVFVDLALGQISSLGVAFAAFIGTGINFHSSYFHFSRGVVNVIH
jgi:zinc/manganese transport system permease protein